MEGCYSASPQSKYFLELYLHLISPRKCIEQERQSISLRLNRRSHLTSYIIGTTKTCHVDRKLRSIIYIFYPYTSLLSSCSVHWRFMWLARGNRTLSDRVYQLRYPIYRWGAVSASENLRSSCGGTRLTKRESCLRMRARSTVIGYGRPVGPGFNNELPGPPVRYCGRHLSVPLNLYLGNRISLEWSCVPLSHAASNTFNSPSHLEIPSLSWPFFI